MTTFPRTSGGDNKLYATQPWKGAWLCNPAPDSPNTGNTITDVTNGTIYQYLGGGDATKLYRCPSLAFIELASGTGSNGTYDYTAFGVFSGALVWDIKTTTDVNRPGLTSEKVLTPLIVEEDPAKFMNGGTDRDGDHDNNDTLATTHFKGINYGSPGGNAQYLSNTAGTFANNWTGYRSNGTAVIMRNWEGPKNIPWNWWGTNN